MLMQLIMRRLFLMCS
nr:unnamed protein product [Callosobruchus analis]